MESFIKSRPQYLGLHPQPLAEQHLIAAEGAGSTAALRLLDEAPAVFIGRTFVLYAHVGASPDAGRLPARDGIRCEMLPTGELVLSRLADVLQSATMGTRLYVTGTEGFIGRALSVAIESGMDHRSVLTEHRGSLARRVQCVHCKTFAEGITVSIYKCSGCGNLLFVRDHYSRRLAAFQGVVVNAEDPTERPAAEAIYP